MNSRDILSLIDGDPFDAVWQALGEIWQEDEVGKESINLYYDEKERETTRLEEFLEKTYFEFFAEILARKCATSDEVSRLLETDRFALVIMDGLSLREASLLVPRLVQEGNAVDLSYSFSVLPSTTGPFIQRYFGRDSAADLVKVGFHYIRDEDDLPHRIEGDQVKVWCRLPDALLHPSIKGKTELWTPEEIFLKTEAMLLEILKRIRGHEEIIVTADHGYIIAKAGCTFALSRADKRALKRAFGGDRASRIIDTPAIRRLEEQGLIVPVDDHYLVKGRYCWELRGQYSVYVHDGLSLMECVVPWIEISFTT